MGSGFGLQQVRILRRIVDGKGTSSPQAVNWSRSPPASPFLLLFIVLSHSWLACFVFTRQRRSAFINFTIPQSLVVFLWLSICIRAQIVSWLPADLTAIVLMESLKLLLGSSLLVIIFTIRVPQLSLRPSAGFPSLQLASWRQTSREAASGRTTEK